jgi:PAS domain S-box-containing protein
MPLKQQKGPESSTDIILESISDGVFTVDLNWKITSFNRAAEEITGIPRREAIGQRCSDVFRASMCEVNCALRQTMEKGSPIINQAAFIISAEGKRIPISVSTALLKDKKSKVIGGVETFRDLSLVEELRKELKGGYHLGDWVSQSQQIRKLFEILPQVASSGATVLIQGETGTGKDFLAKTIHNLSPRKKYPFVAVNCGAIPEALLESELFGYKAGAFTGATRDKPGRFTLADKGTLFLDEIGELTPAIQVKLLRVLQDKTFEPLGGTRTHKADVRVIAATNKNLAGLVKKGLFREDLYYRIHVIQLDLPPLRSRKEDIPLLIEHFIQRFNRIQGKTISGVTVETLSLLMSYDYPGNIRELENIIEHAFVLCNEGMIQPQHLPDTFMMKSLPALRAHYPGKDPFAILETQLILQTLARNQFDREAAVRELGIHKSTFYRKIKKLKINLPPAR